MVLDIEPEILDIKNMNVPYVQMKMATFIKELVVELPKGEKLDFKAGGYIQIDVPAYKGLEYKSFKIGAEYRDDWEQFNMFDLVADNDEDCFRAYSMANYPLEDDIIMLNIRIASPSRYGIPSGNRFEHVFDLEPGDKITISVLTENSLLRKPIVKCASSVVQVWCLCVHTFDQLKRIKTDRKITFGMADARA